MKIGIFVGSFKPPHKGHFEMVKNAIQKDKLNKVVIIISKNPRYLKDIIQNPKNYNITDFEKEFKRTFKTKSEAYDYIKSVKSKYPSISVETSKKIWTIYLDFLKENSKLSFNYVIKSGFLYSPIMNTNVFLKSELKKVDDYLLHAKDRRSSKQVEAKKNKYILYKSSKNAENSRFDYLLGKYSNYKNLISKTIIMKYNINARDFRNAIDFKKNITKFLPKLPLVSQKMIKKLFY
jgi:cytidyltransferase-like protein